MERDLNAKHRWKNMRAEKRQEVLDWLKEESADMIASGDDAEFARRLRAAYEFLRDDHQFRERMDRKREAGLPYREPR